MTTVFRAAAALAVALCLFAGGWVRADGTRLSELTAVLGSDADALTKSRACKELSALDDPAAVPALAALLSDPQLAAYARTALEGLADPSAGVALIESLSELEGALRIGAINSLGVRGCAESAPQLIELSRTADAATASAALSALSRIPTREAVAALAEAVTQGRAELVPPAAEACLASAELMRRGGEAEAALTLCRSVRRSSAPRVLRLAATTGEVLTLGPAAGPIVTRYGRSVDPAVRNAALRAARLVPGTEISRALLAALEGSSVEARVALVETLAGREDREARAGLESLLACPTASVRRAALRGLGDINPARIPFVALFDGRTFEGWEGDTAESFRIEQGAIVGGNLETAIPRNEFLCTTETYSNFILRLECKVVSANGGIQFRSQRVPGSAEVSGYQADMDSSGTYWGCLYDESRRGMLVEADRSETARVVKQDDWNHYEIRCEGAHIQLFVNGLRTIDYTEADASIPRSGIIAVQVHAGAPSETWYRNIEIAELP